jgi:hypothetical protein
MRSIVAVLTCVAAAAGAMAQADPGKLEVFQDLDEATSRIPRLAAKPHEKLLKACGGEIQNEVMIFKDAETGKEVWSLTREQCNEMAHTGRRPAWSCNGQFISFKGNAAFWNPTENAVRKRAWAGYTYIANADGSHKRALYATLDGKVSNYNCNQYNMWDANVANAWYCVVEDKLIRVLIADGLTDSKAEAVYTFPNAAAKVIQEISDGNFMLIEEKGDKPNCYVVNLNRAPSDPHFCLTYPLKGAIHSGSFRFMRSKKIVHGGYEDIKGGVVLSFADETRLTPADPAEAEVHVTAGRQMDHLWYGLPDDRVGFFGKYNGKHGLWMQLPGEVPVLMADVPDGHVTWCGRDPEWCFAAVGPGSIRDKQYDRRLLACNADGKTVEIVCTPYDRRRPGPTGYGSIPLPTQSRDGNKCWFHSSMLMPTNDYTGSYVAVFHKPRPPAVVTVVGMPRGLKIRWTPHPVSFEVKGCRVYRADEDGVRELTREALKATEFADTTIRPGGTYSYFVTSEEWSRLESDVSSPVITVQYGEQGPALVDSAAGTSGWDTAPPAEVKQFTAKITDGLVDLNWRTNADPDLRYYNIYASSQAAPDAVQQRLLVSPTHDQTRYLDWSAPAGGPMYYAITAVDRQGNESKPVFAQLPRR